MASTPYQPLSIEEIRQGVDVATLNIRDLKDHYSNLVGRLILMVAKNQSDIEDYKLILNLSNQLKKTLQ